MHFTALYRVYLQFLLTKLEGAVFQTSVCVHYKDNYKKLQNSNRRKRVAQLNIAKLKVSYSSFF